MTNKKFYFVEVPHEMWKEYERKSTRCFETRMLSFFLEFLFIRNINILLNATQWC